MYLSSCGVWACGHEGNDSINVQVMISVLCYASISSYSSWQYKDRKQRLCTLVRSFDALIGSYLKDNAGGCALFGMQLLKLFCGIHGVKHPLMHRGLFFFFPSLPSLSPGTQPTQRQATKTRSGPCRHCQRPSIWLSKCLSW